MKKIKASAILILLVFTVVISSCAKQLDKLTVPVTDIFGQTIVDDDGNVVTEKIYETVTDAMNGEAVTDKNGKAVTRVRDGVVTDKNGKVLFDGGEVQTNSINEGLQTISSSKGNSESDYKTLKLKKGITFGGSRDDYFDRVIPLDDGGYIVLGNVMSKDGDCKTVKSSWKESIGVICRYKADGTLKWKEFFGGKNGVELYDVAVLKDGKIIAVGQTSSDNFATDYRGDTDAVLIKLDDNGKTLWKKNFGGNDFDTLRAVEVASDGGFYVCGKTNSNDKDLDKCGNPENDALLVKFSADGKKEWLKTFGGTSSDDFYDLCKDSSDNLFVLCNSKSIDGDMRKLAYGNGDQVVVKYDKSGKMLFAKSYSHSGTEVGYVIKSDNDGGCIFAGTFAKVGLLDGVFKSCDYSDGKDGFVIRINSSGKVLWVNTFGGTGDEDVRDILIVKNEYYIFGNTDSSNGEFSAFSSKGSNDFYVKSYSKSGERLWLQSFGGSGEDGAYSACMLKNGSLMICGYTFSSDKDFAGINKGKSENAFLGKYSL